MHLGGGEGRGGEGRGGEGRGGEGRGGEGRGGEGRGGEGRGRGEGRGEVDFTRIRGYHSFKMCKY